MKMTGIISKAFIFCLSICLAVAMLFPCDVQAAAKTPAKPIITSAKATDNTVRLTWKKAKNAKKYKVFVQTGKDGWKYWKSVKATKKNKKKYSNTLKYKLKKSGKKYKVYVKKHPYRAVKTTTARSYKYKGKYDTVYRFVVQAVNGKKLSRYSAPKAVRTGLEMIDLWEPEEPMPEDPDDQQPDDPEDPDVPDPTANVLTPEEAASPVAALDGWSKQGLDVVSVTMEWPYGNQPVEFIIGAPYTDYQTALGEPLYTYERKYVMVYVFGSDIHNANSTYEHYLQLYVAKPNFPSKKQFSSMSGRIVGWLSNNQEQYTYKDITAGVTINSTWGGNKSEVYKIDDLFGRSGWNTDQHPTHLCGAQYGNDSSKYSCTAIGFEDCNECKTSTTNINNISEYIDEEYLSVNLTNMLRVNLYSVNPLKFDTNVKTANAGAKDTAMDLTAYKHLDYTDENGNVLSHVTSGSINPALKGLSLSARNDLVRTAINKKAVISENLIAIRYTNPSAEFATFGFFNDAGHRSTMTVANRTFMSPAITTSPDYGVCAIRYGYYK